MIRYLAEAHDNDPACAQIALQLKKVQSAIGEWHDWQALAREIRRGHWKSKDAAELLAEIAAESFESALIACRGTCHMVAVGNPVVSEVASPRKAPDRAHPERSETAHRKLA